MSDLTRLLEAANRGDAHAAASLLPLVYDELRKLAAAKLASEKPGQTLDATALVHEAYLRMVPDARPQAAWAGRGHFFAAAAEAMRRILVDNARRKQTAKHGGAREREELHPDLVAAPQPDDELLVLNEALDRLAAKEPQKAEVAKLVICQGICVSPECRESADVVVAMVALMIVGDLPDRLSRCLPTFVR